MHICFVTHEYPKKGYAHGGIGSFVKTIASELVQNGVRVSVIGTNYTTKDEFSVENGVHLYRLRKRKLKGFTWWLNTNAISRKIAEIHRLHPISIVETSELGLAFLDKIPAVKYVVRLHGGHHFFSEAENRTINWWKGFQEKKSFRKADAFVAVSDYVKTHTAKYLSYQGKTVVNISNPVNTAMFRPLAVEIVPHSIIFAGTVCEKKGIRQLIQAFPSIKKDFPAATLEVYGRDWFFSDGSSYLKMLQQTELPKIGALASDIHFHGAVDHTHLPEIYGRAQVCVFPSHMETQGLVAPEAMLMEKVVVFTEKGPGPETIVHRQTGLLCDPHDPQSIADQVKWVFSNPDQLTKMEKNAREAALCKYSLLKIAEKNLSFYRSL